MSTFSKVGALSGTLSPRKWAKKIAETKVAPAMTICVIFTVMLPIVVSLLSVGQTMIDVVVPQLHYSGGCVVD